MMHALRPRPRYGLRGFTLLEVLIVLAIMATLAGLAVPMYLGQREKLREDEVVSDIRLIEIKIMQYMNERDVPPPSLNELAGVKRKDPWGRNYEYLQILGNPTPTGMRKDRNLHPINSDFDLFSRGPDGATSQNLQNPYSKDDIIRANNGRFVGRASNY